jgi:tetratricopeptide (TPR) repeat protein
MSRFSKTQEEVRHLIRIEKYDEAIELCEKKLQYLEYNDIESDNNFWFFNLRLAICYRRKQQYKKALSYVNKSSLHAKEQHETMECWWTLANCYFCLNNYKSAIKFYKKCQDYYKGIGDERGYYVTTFNIAKINMDKDIAEEIVTKLNRNETNSYLIDNAYGLLCEIFLENNDVQSAQDIIHNIHSESVKRDEEVRIVNYLKNYACM